MMRSVTFSERPDVAALRAQAKAETGLHDLGDSQFRGPLADPASGNPSVYHVRYPDVVADPAAVVRAAYEYFGLPSEGGHARRPGLAG